MRVLIHLGYPRTGTTFLQKNIFPIHKQINFLGPNNYHNMNEAKITQSDLNLLAMINNEFNLNKKIISKTDKDFIQHFDENKINVISTEAYTMFQNVFYDFKDLRFLEILIKQKYKSVKFDFLIVLRSQYDLIKSIYHFNYHKISEILRIKDFKLIFDLLDMEIPDKYNFPLNQFLYNYDFYHLHNKLLSKFNNSKINYLFYEDFKLDKNNFSNDLSSYLDLEKEYTENLFNAEAINSRKVYSNNNYYIKSKIYRFLKSKLYFYIKNLIPFKTFLKKIFINNFVYSKIKYVPEEEEKFQKKIKKYYKNSNLKFFNQVKINNKFDY